MIKKIYLLIMCMICGIFSHTIIMEAHSNYSLSKEIYAEESVSSLSGNVKVWTDENNIKFPITPKLEKWKTYESHQEMVNACTVPQKVLEKLSTQKLISLVLDYPLLSDFYCYNSYEEGLYYLVSNFNGLRDLLKREDMVDELIEKYQTLKIPQNNYKNNNCITGQQSSNILDLSFKIASNIELIETIFVNDYFVEQCSNKQINKIADIVFDKIYEKKGNSLFLGKENFIYKVANEVCNSEIIENYKMKMATSVLATNGLFVTTPNGTKVPVLVQFFNGTDWAKAMDKEFSRTYPKAQILRSSDNRYNCHSYAWYKQSMGNTYWMNNPAAYVNDGSYKKVTNKDNRAANNRIRWVNYALKEPLKHSGYLKKINSDGTYTVYSKWGEGPLMSHKAKYSPYDGTREYFKRN